MNTLIYINTLHGVILRENYLDVIIMNNNLFWRLMKKEKHK